jgi:hypothetical protein
MTTGCSVPNSAEPADRLATGSSLHGGSRLPHPRGPSNEVVALRGTSLRRGRPRHSTLSCAFIAPRWSSVNPAEAMLLTNGWEGTPPAGEHIVVVTHRPRPEGWHPEASCQFVDDVGRAIMVAKQLAGDRDVAVTAGNVGGQALALGLVDEVAMDVVPVVFGRGKRYFGALDAQ